MVTITITDDRGSVKVVDFDSIAGWEERAPESTLSIHGRIMEALKNESVQEPLRGQLLEDLQVEMLQQFVYSHVTLCDRCQEFLLNELVHYYEQRDQHLCGRCL